MSARVVLGALGGLITKAAEDSVNGKSGVPAPQRLWQVGLCEF